MLSAFLAASRRATRLLLSRKSQGNKTGPSSRYWDQFFGVTAQQADANRAEWQAHPVVAAYQDRQRGGRSLEQWFVDEVLRGAKVKHGLGIGSGAAPFEVGLVKAGVIEHLDVVDFSEAAITSASAFADSLEVGNRVSFRAHDANRLELPAHSYDLIVFISSLHHLSELDLVLARCREALRPGGVVFAHEYIGPSRFAYPERDLVESRRLFDAAPPSLKGGAFAVPDPAQVAEADPTEAVRSSEIESCFRRAFPDATVVPRNGGLLFTLWWSLNHDALFDTQEGIQFVRELCERDESLTQNGALPSYFADLWARTVE